MSATEDQYGNPIEDGEYVDGRILYCCFPDCGCDGSRLCMAEQGASERACEQNVEQMYRARTPEARRAVFALVGSVARENNKL